MEKTKGSLADKIADILSTAPGDFDPEEEDAVDDTKAKLLQSLDTDEDSQEAEVLSKFRKQNVDLLADVDEKYAGKKASRVSLQDFHEEDDSEDQEHSDASESDENEENSDIEEEEDAEEESDIGDEEYEDGSEEDSKFKHLNESNMSNQLKKALSVRNQMAMWEHLLETRIQLQKCLITSNKLPDHAVYQAIKQESGNEFTNKVAEVKTTLKSLLDKFLYLQQSVLSQYPETKNLGKADNKPTAEGSDEEIPSDTEPEDSDEESQNNEEDSKEPPKKKQKLQDYGNNLETQHNQYKEYRNGVIQKWNDKTRLAVKSTTSHSVLNQIEYTLSNKDRLIKKTQLKRSQYNIVGDVQTETDEATTGEEHKPEIFDDDDFYHQLLRELIEFKSADVTDPIQLGRQWIQLQNMRSKMKRKIDTRATKGRKIRYAVHSKLVNFMAPIHQGLYTEEAKNELYNSLFGKNQPLFHS